MRGEVNDYYYIKSLPYIYLVIYLCMYNNIYTIIAGMCVTQLASRRRDDSVVGENRFAPESFVMLN